MTLDPCICCQLRLSCLPCKQLKQGAVQQWVGTARLSTTMSFGSAPSG